MQNKKRRVDRFLFCFYGLFESPFTYNFKRNQSFRTDSFLFGGKKGILSRRYPRLSPRFRSLPRLKNSPQDCFFTACSNPLLHIILKGTNPFGLIPFYLEWANQTEPLTKYYCMGLNSYIFLLVI